MPTIYAPITRLEPPDYTGDLNRIDVHIETSRPQIQKLLKSCGIEFEDDDHERFYDDVRLQLTKFTLNVIALPGYTPRKLISTAKAIARDPARFLESSETYDREAAARILGVCARVSPANQAAVLEYELGKGAGPPAEEIALAARAVIEDLEKLALARRAGGANKLLWQTTLAIDLARVFMARGGKITRNVGRKNGLETGPFHQFLEIVLPCVRGVARQAGFALTVTTIVAKARNALRNEGSKGVGRSIPS